MLIAMTGISVLCVTIWFTWRPLAERYAPNWILRRIVGPTVLWPLFQPQTGPTQDWAIKILQNRRAVVQAREQGPGKERLAQIEAELTTGNNPAWAGRYVTQPSFGFCFHLSLAPKSGYIIETAAAQPGRREVLTHGDIASWNEDHIELRSAIDVNLNPDWMPRRFLIIRWDDVVCLIPEIHATEFAHDANAGWWTPFTWYAPADAARSWFKPGELSMTLPTSNPKGPPEIAALMLSAPIQATVLEVLPSRTESVNKAGQAVGHHYLRLNVGQQQGVFVDMRFYRPDIRLAVPAVVELVDLNSCVVRLSIVPPPGKAPRVPAIGSVLSTRKPVGSKDAP